MTSSGKNGLNIRTNASPKWDRTRCPEVMLLEVSLTQQDTSDPDNFWNSGLFIDNASSMYL